MIYMEYFQYDFKQVLDNSRILDYIVLKLCYGFVAVGPKSYF